MTLARVLSEYIFACFTGLWVPSHEHSGALREFGQMFRDQEWRLGVWDVEAGLQIPGADQPADAVAATRSLPSDPSTPWRRKTARRCWCWLTSITPSLGRNRAGHGSADHPR